MQAALALGFTSPTPAQSYLARVLANDRAGEAARAARKLYVGGEVLGRVLPQPDVITSYLERLKPENSNVALVSPSFTTPEKEKAALEKKFPKAKVHLADEKYYQVPFVKTTIAEVGWRRPVMESKLHHLGFGLSRRHSCNSTPTLLAKLVKTASRLKR